MLKKSFSDQIFQKLKFFLIHKSGNIVLFYWIKHPSETCRKLSFRTSSLCTKITRLSYTKKGADGCWISDKNCKKMLSSPRIRTKGLPESKKSEKFLSKALPWSYWSFLLKVAEFTKSHFKTIYLPKQI